jgi:hypothetical protein
MTRSQKLAFCLIATISLGTALAQTSTIQPNETPAASSSPVAYVYVSRPTHVDGFAASSTGKLTPVPGSPFSGISVFHMSVTQKFLIGAGDDFQTIYTYSIASNGSLRSVASLDATKYAMPGCCYGPQAVDFTGSTFYNSTANTNVGSFQETFKIESNGDLQFIGNTETDGTFDIKQVFPTGISFLGNNKFAYQTGCNRDDLAASATAGFKRESSGLLQPLGAMRELPKGNGGEIFCPTALATDPSDHLAMVLTPWFGGIPDGSNVLASYTADSHGNLSTKSTIENMATIGLGGFPVGPMSISASGKLLAIGVQYGSGGFQVFHFNGSDPITKYTGLLNSGETFVEFGWDKDNHLYALSFNRLHVYSATSTSIKEEPGSPYSIPEASSVIVLSLE